MAKKFSFDGICALVTGASSGIGAEIARQLAQRGAASLMLVARREERLEKLRQELHVAFPKLRIETAACDLSSIENVQALIGQIDRMGVAVDCLVNDAGLGDLGGFASSDWKRIQQMLAVNITALTALTHHFLAGMFQRGRGGILNVGSTAGFLPLPTFAVYAASKAYVNNFSEALRIEVLGSGVHVTALCPGPVDTEFGEVAERSSGTRRFRPPKLFYIPAARVAREALAGLSKNRARIIPGKRLVVPMLAAEMAPKALVRWALGLGVRLNPIKE